MDDKKKIRQFQIGFFDYANKSKPTNSERNYFVEIERFCGGKIQSISAIGDMTESNKHNFGIDSDKHNKCFFFARVYVQC